MAVLMLVSEDISSFTLIYIALLSIFSYLQRISC